MIPRLLGRATARLQRTRTLALVGGSSLALALGVAFLPWLFPAAVFRPVSELVASPAAIVAFGVVAGLFGAQSLRESATGSADRNDATDATDGGTAASDRWPPGRAPERAYYDEYRTAGSQIDGVFGANPDETDDLYSRRQKARSRIRETAISAVADAEGIDSEAAARQVAAGLWTDDPRAAAFLGGRHLAPLRTRIRDWASGERFERWATHAVAEVEARERGETATLAESDTERERTGRGRRGTEVVQR